MQLYHFHGFRVMPCIMKTVVQYFILFFYLLLAEFIKIILHCSLDHFERMFTIIYLLDGGG